MPQEPSQVAPDAPPDVRVPGRRIAQRVGWGLLALFVLAGAAGLFGAGPTISVPRLALLYLLLMALFRLAGRRTLADISPFDFVLLLIISELVQQAIVAGDPSLTNAAVLCAALVAIDIALSLLKSRSRRVERWLEGTPALLVQHGQPIERALRAMRIDETDILAAARQSQGLERMDQIRFAVLEKSGGISIVPEPEARA